MAKRKTLKDSAGNIVYPTTKAGVVYMPDNSTTVDQAINAKPTITVTGTDPGEGQPLAANNFIAVYGDIIDLIYPVGSIYMSATLSTATAVNNALGGTWVAWGAGRVPVGVNTSETEFNSVEKTGGAKTHTLTTAQLPSHKHDGLFFSSAQVTRDGTSGDGAINLNNAWQNVGNGLKASTGDTGSGSAHNNLQPYITCYMYKRTA